MNRRVVVTGMAGVTAFGNDWASVGSRLRAGKNAVVQMPEWAVYDGLNTRLAAPIPQRQQLSRQRLYQQQSKRQMRQQTQHLWPQRIKQQMLCKPRFLKSSKQHQ